MYLSLHPLPQARLFHDAIYSGTLYLILAAVILFALGFKARKPLFGQFAAVAGIIVVCQMIWYPTMNYPDRSSAPKPTPNGWMLFHVETTISSSQAWTTRLPPKSRSRPT